MLIKVVDGIITLLAFIAVGCFASALLLCGCSSPQTPEHTVNFDSSFSDAQKQDIEAGFAEWHVASDDSYIDVVPGTDSRCPSEGDYDGYTVGHTMCFYVDAISRNGLTLQHIAAHEYGHALHLRFGGDEHYRGSAPSLMTPDTHTQADSPQAVDLAAIH